MNITTVPTTQDLATTVRTMSRTGKLVFGGLGVATLASFLPWDTVFDSGGDRYQLTPSDLQMLPKILVGVVVTVWAAWPILTGTLSKKRCVGLTAAVVFLSLLPLMNVAQAYGHSGDASIDSFGLSDAVKTNVELGLVMFAGAMIAVWVGVLRAWHGRRSARVTPTPASFPPPAMPTASSGM